MTGLKKKDLFRFLAEVNHKNANRDDYYARAIFANGQWLQMNLTDSLINNRKSDYHLYLKKECSALDLETNRCTIYTHRPYICRKLKEGSNECFNARSREIL